MTQDVSKALNPSALSVIESYDTLDLTGSDGLSRLRASINEVDGDIARLLHERATIVHEIRKVKASYGAHVYDPEREVDVLERAMTRLQGDFPDVAMRFVFREIISGCRALQSSASIAFLGPAGTFTEMAAHALFGSSMKYDERPTVAGVLDAVSRGAADHGVVPLETSEKGVVVGLIDGLLDRSLKIRREFIADVTFALCSSAPALHSVERVYAHPYTLKQCRRWLIDNLPSADLVAMESPGEAMLRARSDPRAATLAGQKAAERACLPILVRDASDRSDSAIRFIVVGREDGLSERANKTLLAIDGRNSPLNVLLGHFAAHQVHVLRVTSAPRVGDWASFLLFELEGKRDDGNMSSLIGEIEASGAQVYMLGSFARHRAVNLREPPRVAPPDPTKMRGVRNGRYRRVRSIHTLGPTGTNLEAASRWWRETNRLLDAEVVLHNTLEDAVQRMAMDGSAVLIACIVYPELHTLVFENLERLEIAECFVYSTYNMVVASRDGIRPSSLATHRAPQHLAPGDLVEKVFVDSNSQAAIACAEGLVDGCVTTLPAAQKYGLQVLKDYGGLPMGFSVHVPRGGSSEEAA